MYRYFAVGIDGRNPRSRDICFIKPDRIMRGKDLSVNIAFTDYIMIDQVQSSDSSAYQASTV